MSTLGEGRLTLEQLLLWFRGLESDPAYRRLGMMAASDKTRKLREALGGARKELEQARRERDMFSRSASELRAVLRHTTEELDAARKELEQFHAIDEDLVVANTKVPDAYVTPGKPLPEPLVTPCPNCGNSHHCWTGREPGHVHLCGFCQHGWTS